MLVVLDPPPKKKYKKKANPKFLGFKRVDLKYSNSWKIVCKKESQAKTCHQFLLEAERLLFPFSSFESNTLTTKTVTVNRLATTVVLGVTVSSCLLWIQKEHENPCTRLDAVACVGSSKLQVWLQNEMRRMATNYFKKKDSLFVFPSHNNTAKLLAEFSGALTGDDDIDIIFLLLVRIMMLSQTLMPTGI